MSIIVPRCGFNRHTKCEILYGPLELGGANFRHLYVEQGIGQVSLFMRNWRLKSTAEKLLRIAVGWFQYQVGTSYSLLERVDTVLPHLESKWLASLRDFLASIQSCFQVDSPGIPKIQCYHDTHIMDAILTSAWFSASEIRRLNYCRLYLQAQTISDLTEVSGRYLDRAKYEGRFSHKSSCTHGMWIHQQRPSPVEWKLWQRANLLWSDESGKLHQALGPWLDTIDNHRQTHSAYQLNMRLWLREHQDYRLCKLLKRTEEGQYSYWRTGTQVEWHQIPLEAVPVEVSQIAADEWIVVERSVVRVLHHPVQVATFEQYVEDLEPWEYDLLSRTNLPTDPFSVGLALSQGVRGVSEGSVVWLKQMGAYGWTLSTDLGERSAEGMGPAPGANPNSDRSEAYGMLAMLCFLQRLAEFTYQHEPWHGTLATDSLSLVETVLGIKRKPSVMEAAVSEPEPVQLPLDPLSPEWDLIVNIRRLLREMPGLSLEHVLGHQDCRGTCQQLSLMAQLNVDADALANTFQREYGALRPHALLTEEAGVHLITPKGTVTTKYKTAIRHQATYGPLLAHLQAQNGWNASTTERINWKAHAACLHKRIK